MVRRALLLCAVILLAAGPLSACTVFYGFDGKHALAGDNEDFWESNNQIWFVAPTKDTYGVMYIGLGTGVYPDGGVRMPAVKVPEGGVTKIDTKELYGFPQQGVNDQGLFYGGAATDVVKLADKSAKPKYDGYFIDGVLRKCATVAEALKFMERYDIRIPQGQILLGDKTGDAVVLEAPDVILRKQGSFQVITNFRTSTVQPERITCKRYQTVQGALGDAKKISIELFRDTLKATGSPDYTAYSTVCDLTNGAVYIYQKARFDKPVRLKLNEEFAKGNRVHKLADLFRD